MSNWVMYLGYCWWYMHVNRLLLNRSTFSRCMRWLWRFRLVVVMFGIIVRCIMRWDVADAGLGECIRGIRIENIGSSESWLFCRSIRLLVFYDTVEPEVSYSLLYWPFERRSTWSIKYVRSSSLADRFTLDGRNASQPSSLRSTRQGVMIISSCYY